MSGIGKSLLVPIALLIVVCIDHWLPVYAFAQQGSDVVVTAAVSETQVFQGERIQYTVTISGNNFRNVGRPGITDNINGFRLLSLQPSTSTSYSIINGVASRSYTYTYTLVAESPGSYTIPPTPIDIDGANFTTNAVNVTVVARSSSTQGSSNQRPDIFIRVEVDDRNPVVGQQVLADLVLYFKAPIEIVSYMPNSNWPTEGFWKETLSDGTNPRAESVILDGERYRKAVLLRHAVFPGRAGELVLGQAKVTATIRNPSRYTDPFNSFFGGFGTNQRTVELTSDPIRLQVRTLPQTDVPTINAVGQYTITRRLGTQRAMVGEAIEVITEIRGTGNLGLVSRPEFDYPDGFEVFQPQESLMLDPATDNIRGTRTFRDIIIVRRPGEFTIEAARLAYYDPSRRRYITTNLPELRLTVSRDPNALAAGPSRNEIGVFPVTGVVRWTRIGSATLISNWWMWLGFILPIVVLVFAYRVKRENDRLIGDINYARRVRSVETANRILDEALEVAKSPTPDVKSVMSKIQKSIYGCVADKVGIEPASLNDHKILDLLSKNTQDGDLLNDLRKTLNKCSTIRFAPVVGRENLSVEIERARNLITRIGAKL